MYFIKGLIFGILIGSINFFLLFFFIKKIIEKKIKPLFTIIYINKFIFIGLLTFFFIKYKFGDNIGLIIGFTLTFIIFNIGVLKSVGFTRSNQL